MRKMVIVFFCLTVLAMAAIQKNKVDFKKTIEKAEENSARIEFLEEGIKFYEERGENEIVMQMEQELLFLMHQREKI